MRLLLLALGVALALPAQGLSQYAEEFMSITKALEPVHREKRKLGRGTALAKAEQRDTDASAARDRFAKLDQEPKTARLEKRLAELEPFLHRSPDPEDLRAINQQRVEAFYRCD